MADYVSDDTHRLTPCPGEPGRAASKPPHRNGHHVVGHRHQRVDLAHHRASAAPQGDRLDLAEMADGLLLGRRRPLHFDGCAVSPTTISRSISTLSL